MNFYYCYDWFLNFEIRNKLYKKVLVIIVIYFGILWMLDKINIVILKKKNRRNYLFNVIVYEKIWM